MKIGPWECTFEDDEGIGVVLVLVLLIATICITTIVRSIRRPSADKCIETHLISIGADKTMTSDLYRTIANECKSLHQKTRKRKR